MTHATMDLHSKFFPTHDELIARAVPSGRYEAVVQMILSLAARNGVQDPFSSDDTIYDVDLCVALQQLNAARDRLKQQRDFVDKTKKLLVSLRADPSLPAASRVEVEKDDESDVSGDDAVAADADARLRGGATRIQSGKPAKVSATEIKQKLARIRSLDGSIENALSEILDAQDKIAAADRDVQRLTKLQQIAQINSRRLRTVARSFRFGEIDEPLMRKSVEYWCERARQERKKHEPPAPPVRVLVTSPAGNLTYKEYDAEEYWLLTHPLNDNSAW